MIAIHPLSHKKEKVLLKLTYGKIISLYYMCILL